MTGLGGLEEGPPGATGPSLQSGQLPGENFAVEPEGWGQVHKVLTRDLTRLQTQVRRLKNRAWPGSLAFSIAAAALSLGGTGLNEIGDYYTSSPRPLNAPSGMAWILAGAGIGIALVGVVLGLIFRLHFRQDVEDVVTEIGTLRYGAETEQ
jgi:hypothetical protein